MISNLAVNMSLGVFMLFRMDVTLTDGDDAAFDSFRLETERIIESVRQFQDDVAHGDVDVQENEVLERMGALDLRNLHVRHVRVGDNFYLELT